MEEVMEGALPASSPGVHPDYFLPGTEVNGFRLVRHVNTGGYGSVWLAESVYCPGRYYAIKFCRYPSGDPGRAAARAEREVLLLLLLAVHPNVLRVIAHGRWGDPETGTHYLVMEWIEGATLLDWTRQHNPPLLQLVRLVQTAARALQAVHEAGVMHRDVKPSNMLVREADGELFLGDFGAGDAAGAPSLTQPGLPPGTPAYRSPEAWVFARRAQTAPYPFQPADDWYALGVTLYVLLTQVAPFPEKLAGQSFEQWVVRRQPVPPHLLNPRVPRALSQVVMRLLAKHPHQRYRDGYALCAALDRALKSRAKWELPVYTPQAPAPSRAAAEAPVESPFGAEPTSPTEKQREAVERRRDELLPRQPRAAWVSRRQVALAAGLLLLTVLAWPAWRWLAAHPGAPQAAGAPATPSSPAPAPPDAAPLFCPPVATPPWEQPPAEAGLPTPSLAFIGPPSWKEDPHVTTMPSLARNTLFAVSAALTTACPAVPVRPEPPTCSPAAIAAMDKLGIKVGPAMTPIWVRSERFDDDRPIELGTGPVASVVREEDDEPDGVNDFPVGTRLFGRVLPSPGSDVLIHYTELQFPPGERIPICAIAYNLVKYPGSPEEFEATSNRAWVEWVHAFPR